MADFVRLTATGFDDVARNLEALSQKVQRKTIKTAMRKAATVIRKKMRSNIRARTKPKTGNLRKSIAKREQTFRNAFVITIGPSHDIAPHAHLVEHGTQLRFRKIITGFRRGKRSWRYKQVSVFVTGAPTGMMPAFYPVRDAFMSTADLAIGTAERELVNGIEQEAAKLGRRGRRSGGSMIEQIARAKGRIA